MRDLSLFLGTEAGKTAGFFYSEAMRESGVIWSEVLLDQYLEDPKGTIPDIRIVSRHQLVDNSVNE